MYTTKEISKMLNVSEETVRRWIRNGLLTAGQDGKSYFITKEDLTAFIEHQTENGSVTSVSKFNQLIPFAAKGGALAGEALINALTKRFGSKATDNIHINTPNKDADLKNIEAHLSHLQRQRKKLEHEYQMKLLDIEDEIAEYEHWIENLK